MELSIILINYKSCALLSDCIQSIVEQTRAGSYEVIVVDNDSRDGAREVLTARYPDIRWVQLDYNAGFARANNAGMQVARGDYFLILNADTLILDRAIDRSLALLKKAEGAVGCGVQLLNTDGSTQISGAHFIRGGLNTLLPLPYLGRLVRYLGYRFKSTIPSVQQVKQDMDVDWIVGAYMLISAGAARKSGLFDEDFFMYAEEIEWCARLRKLGRLILFAEPRVIHIGGGTSGDYYETEESENGKNLWNKKGRQIIVSSMLRIRKQFGAGWYAFILSCYVAELPLFALCLFFDRLFRGSRAWFSWRNVAGYAGNIRVLLRYSLRILRNKPYFYKVA